MRLCCYTVARLLKKSKHVRKQLSNFWESSAIHFQCETSQFLFSTSSLSSQKDSDAGGVGARSMLHCTNQP